MECVSQYLSHTQTFYDEPDLIDGVRDGVRGKQLSLGSNKGWDFKVKSKEDEEVVLDPEDVQCAG